MSETLEAEATFLERTGAVEPDEEVVDFPPEDETFNPEPPNNEPADVSYEEGLLYNMCSTLPEAPALAWTKFIDRKGFTWSVTLRAGLPDELQAEALRSLMRQLNLFRKAAHANDWLPAGNGGYFTPPAAPAKNNSPPPFEAEPSPFGAQQQGVRMGNGVATLNALKVDPDGKVEFHCEGFRWPFKDSRGAEVVAGLFDAETGVEASHLTPGANYTGLNFKCHWEKPGKYYDVVKVTK